MLSNSPTDLSNQPFIPPSRGGSAVKEDMGIVPTMINAASQAKIEVHPLRRKISMLEGSGGNIAVLVGKDGKLLIDAGFTVSKPRIVPALDSLSADPITRLINTLAYRSHGRQRVVARGRGGHHGA